MNYATLGQKVKEKYPEYLNVPDDELGRKIVEKYPEYQAHITPDTPETAPIVQPEKNLIQSLVEAALPAPSAIAQDAKASERVPTYVKSQEDQTKRLMDLVNTIKYARSIGNKDLENQAILESRNISNSQEDQAPVFSNATERGDSYLGRGLKSGVQGGSYFIPAAGGKSLLGTTLAGGVSSGAFGATLDGATPGSVLRDTATGAVIAGGGKAIGDKAGKWLAVKSSHATPSQLDAFRKITGQDFGDYLVSKGVPSASGQAQIVEALNNEYGDMVRTGQKISKGELKAFLDNAVTQFRSKSGSLERGMVADNVAKRSGYLLDVPKLDTNMIADTKSDAFGGLSKKAINSPEIQSGGKEFGKYLIDFLDKKIPGSRDKGRELKTAIEAMDVLSRQSNNGRGSQVFNLFKAPVGGAIAGVGYQGIHDGGINPANMIAAGVAGTVAAKTLNSPTTQRLASRLVTSEVPRLFGQSVYKIADGATSIGKDQKDLSPQDQISNVPAKEKHLPTESLSTQSYGSQPILPSDSQNSSRLFDSPTSYTTNTKKTLFKAPKLPKLNLKLNL